MSDALREAYRAAIRAALDHWSSTPLVWGTSDCALSIADIDVAVTGRDTARRFRGRYASPTEAARLLGDKGLPGALSTTARARHWRRIAPASARTGDRGIALLHADPVQVLAHINVLEVLIRPDFDRQVGKRFPDHLAAERALTARLTKAGRQFIRRNTRPAMVIRYGDFWVGRRDYGFAAVATDQVSLAYAIC